MSIPKSQQTKIEEVDILKFQILAAYLGMRTQDVKISSQEIIIAESHKRDAEGARTSAEKEVLQYQAWLQEEYNIGPNDRVDYSHGLIERGNPIDNQTKIQEEESQDEGQKEEGQKESTGQEEAGHSEDS